MPKYIVAMTNTFDTLEEAQKDAIGKVEWAMRRDGMIDTYSVCEVIETYSIVSSVKKTDERESPTPTAPPDGTEWVFTDSRDWREYKTLWINGKEWMNENLKYLPEGQILSPEWSWSDKDKGHISETENRENWYLYQWSSAMECCPEGWHLPSKDELAKANLGGNPKWNKMYAGYRQNDSVGTFCGRASCEYLWSSTTSSASAAWYEGFIDNSYGFSVRYVRD